MFETSSLRDNTDSPLFRGNATQRTMFVVGSSGLDTNESSRSGPNVSSLLDQVVISDRVNAILEPIILHATMTLNIIGVVTNTINCRVFIKQGIRSDSTNIGFLCLSLCDLFSCATLIPYEACFIVKYVGTIETMYTCTCYGIILAWIHTPLVRVSTWTTVYISLIRTISVFFPFRVKFLFTPTVTVIYIITVTIMSALVQLSLCIFNTIDWVFHPGLNTTVLVVKDSPTARTVMYYQQLIIYQILTIVAVIIVTINTGLLSHKLIEVKKWRQHNSSCHGISSKQRYDGFNSTKPSIASKDIEVIKSITAVTTIHLVCVLMAFIPSIAVTAYPGVSYAGINRNLFFISFSIRSLFDAINSSINFFFYIRVSTRYKTSFTASFKCWKDESKTSSENS